MSLDVSLLTDLPVIKRGSGVFIRQDGINKELTLEEVKLQFPDAIFDNQLKQYSTDEIYSANITHNLGKMAKEAGIYECLWRPEELDITKASQLIVPLAKGLETLLTEPEKFKEFNPTNDWGNYDGLVDFIRKYLEACINHPNTKIQVSR